MEVFNKLYSQVSSTVSQLSGVLPGNPVTREFDATAHIASGGPGLQWKIYKGSKKSTKQPAAIFVFEKRQLDKYSKVDRDIILDTIKRGITQLTKIRHPQVLTVQHPLEESRESLAFATEPVFASLANILGQTTNMPQPTNLNNYKFYDIEIKYGLLQIGEGLAFLHNDVKLLHKNISPESIMINGHGVWKLFGFEFCVHNTAQANIAPCWPFEDYSPTVPSVAQPNLDFMAPECMQTQSTASDMFSLGMLAFSLYSKDKKPFSTCRDLQQFRGRNQQLKQLSANAIQPIPDVLREYVKMMLNVTAELRPDAHQFTKIPYFEDVGVKTLNYLDSLLQWDNLQKSQFYRGLPEALAQLPQRVRLHRVMPCLCRDLSQPTMVPFVLPPLLDIAQHCEQKEFVNYVLPHLKPVMKLTEPIQILLIFLQRMELLLKLTPADDVQAHVLPMLYSGLDSDTAQIHELCLSVLPTFAGLLNHAAVKNSLLPRIKRLCLSTSSLSVRVNCLLCIGRLLENLDKWLVLDEVLPFLPQIPSREPAVLMGILGIYKLAMNHKKLGISKEVMATRILPFLIPLCIENGLSLPQFNALVALVKQMFALVETDHRTKLEQLNTVQEQQKAMDATMPQVVSANAPAKQPLDAAFVGLGLESFGGGGGLSIEDKQRLTQQQDVMEVFKTQSALEPKTAAGGAGGGAAARAEPKDLLSAGLAQSLNSFAQQSSTAQSAWKQPNSFASPTSSNTPFSPSGGGMSFPTSSSIPSAMGALGAPVGASMLANPLNASLQQQQQQQQRRAPTSFAAQSQAQPWSSAGVAPPAKPWTNASQWSQPQPAPSAAPPNAGKMSAGNWSALDSLLPTSGAAGGKLPLNQIVPQRQPLMGAAMMGAGNNRNAGNAAKALSQDEIMDLLS